MEKRSDMILVNFTGVYKEQQFYQGEKISWMEVQGLSGCSCYCDGEAMETLEQRMEPYSPEGIHYLDSGNYHYMSLLWLRKIKEPFRLLVFDNHTDMQQPAFGGLLSCGGWAAAALEELLNLTELVLVGPDEEAFGQTDPVLRQKVCFLSRERLAAMTKEEKTGFFRELGKDLPCYLSVDKDILCREDASTDWSQGDMRLEELEACLQEVFASQSVIGMDVCGESSSPGSCSRNEQANERLWKIWKNRRNFHEK